MTEKDFYDQNFETGTSPEEKQHPPKKGGGFLEFLVILIVAFALVFGVVRPYVVEAFYIPSESMVPTLEIGDRVFVNKFIYNFTEPARGDIMVFKSVEGREPAREGGVIGTIRTALGLERDSREDLIKRVVGVAGDEITVEDGTLFVNGERMQEPYVNAEFPDTSFFGPLTVPEGEVFAMGDNRANSRDSRFFGPVPLDNIEGEAFVKFWPPTRIGPL